MTALVLVLLLLLGVPGARSSGCVFSGGRRLLQEPMQAGASPAPGPSDAAGIQTLEVDTQVSDCLIFRNRYYDVQAISNARALVTASANQQPVELDCCRSCKNTTSCNVWQWCPHPEGCQIAGVDIDFPYLGCELLHIGGFSPYAQGNLTMISGPGVPFTSGGSVDIVVPDAPGYELIAGADFGDRYDYNCSGSITPGMCELQAPVEEVAGNCTADPNCQAFVFFPDGIDFTGPKPVGILKASSTGLSRLLTQLNPSAAAYFKGSSNGGGGPGGGGGGARVSRESDSNADLIAGIVGGLGGFLLLAGIGAGLLYFRVYRKRQRLAQAVPVRGIAAEQGNKEEEEEGGEGSPGSQPSGGGSSEGSGVGRTANGGPPSRPASELALVSLELQQQQQQGSLKESGGSRGSLPRSSSPPSVVDAHLGGLLGEAQQAAGHAEGSEAGGSGGQAVELEEGSSPFMFLDPATIAAMQAAAPAVVAFESPVAARGLRHQHSGHSRHSGSPPRSQHHPSLRRELHSGFTAATATTATGSSGSPAHALQLPAVPQGPSSGWEEVIVAQLSAARAASAVTTPPGSMAAGSTARELLEAFAKLYRQRPTVDYSALEGVLEVDAQAGAGPAGSASVSPQSTLGLGGVGEAPGAAGAAAAAVPALESVPQQGQQQQAAWPQQGQQQEQQQAQQPRVQFDPGVRGGGGVSGGGSGGGSSSMFGASVSTSSMVLPEMPWSDWALQPEEVEVCRRADGSWWQLGSGACGTVYKGLYHGVQPVAVKVLHQREDGRRADVFMREVTMLKGLRDRNIVQFLGASLDGVSAMLVTEFMELGDLWRALPIKNHNGERVFGWYRRGRRVALDVARGLHYLHHKRVVHLDLKSANILLSRHGSAKIGDIGMARVLNRDYLTVLSGLGTFAWSAPEVLAGRRCTEKVDIYSFGIVLWEICTGEVPVRGDLRPLAAPEDCPQAVVDLYLRCTAEDPLERPTAIEIVELLSALPHEPPPGTAAAPPPAAAAAAAVLAQLEQSGQPLASLAPLQAAAAARHEQGIANGS